MQEFLTILTRGLEGTPAGALGAAFTWGFVSILLSPCHLATLPLVAGFFHRQGSISTRRAIVISTLVAVGILAGIGMVGLVTTAAGRLPGNVGRKGNYLVIVTFCVVGLYLAGGIPLLRKGILSAFGMGLAFGVAVGPCTFAWLAPLRGVTFRLAASNMLYGMVLPAACGAGLCAVIVLAGIMIALVQCRLNWSERSRGTTAVGLVCGVMVMLGGVWLISTAP